MNVLAKHIIFDAENSLFRKVHPVLLDIFCRGVQAAKSKWLMVGVLISITTSPLGWVIIIFKNIIHLVILLVFWWFLKEYMVKFGQLDYVLLIVGIVVIFYKDIYKELLNFFLEFFVLVTGGGLLRWVCSGYLSGSGFRQKLLTTEPMEGLVGTLVAAIPIEYRDRYDEVMDLYLNSNNVGNEDRLNQILRKYSQQFKQD